MSSARLHQRLAGRTRWLHLARVRLMAASASVTLVFACSSDEAVERVENVATGGGAGAVGTGGAATAGDGGADAGAVFLGRRCFTSLDCGDRLDCLTVDSGAISGMGPPGGYCTLGCTATGTECEGLASAAACVDFGGGPHFCALRCVTGPATTAGKCHERRDAACLATEGTGDSAVCRPLCNSDADCCGAGVACGPARFCDPASGLCATTRVTGAPVGVPCGGPTDTSCRGMCRGVPGTDPPRFTCTERCTYGAFPACGFGPDADAAVAYCYFADDPVVEASRAAGDAGYCAATCSCTVACVEGFQCEPFADPGDALATGRSGVCAGRGTGTDTLECAAGGGGGVAGAGASGAVAGVAGIGDQR